MASFSLTFVVILFNALPSTLCVQQHKLEAHAIMKRMAEMGGSFQGHDVANIHLLESQGQRRRRLAKRDLRDVSRAAANSQEGHDLELGLSSGSKIKLALRPSGVVGPFTTVSHHTASGHSEDSAGLEDCYFHGQIQDASGQGWASVSQCDGLFGFARSPKYEYFLHPVEGRRSKRETVDYYDVHVLWQLTDTNVTTVEVEGDGEIEEEEDEGEKAVNLIDVSIEDFVIPKSNKVARRLKGSNEDRINNTKVVIEMAMFSDAQYIQLLSRVYPGRETLFLLTRLAGTQALYSNHEKVGYDVKIKLKSMEFWTTNPKGYTFTQKLSHNLRNFCTYTKNKYFYDIHSLNTGVTDWNDGKVGLAYVRGACSKRRCMVTKGMAMKTFVLFAHELGHTLGLSHHGNSKCPGEMKKIGGFMGGGTRYNFSPCMKRQLGAFLNSSRSNCLFRESADMTTPFNYHNLPNMFPGQILHPDGLCKMRAGPGYGYVPVTTARKGEAVCRWMVCLNENKLSPAFGRALKFDAPTGFPCGDGSFCMRHGTCKPWKAVHMSLKAEILEESTRIPEWSEWSSSFSECSRTCGTGVRTKRRVCQYTSFSLAPYCPGRAVKPELCNTQPCPGDPTRETQLRRHRGNEVCARFLRDKVKLFLNKKARGYTRNARHVTFRDVKAKVNYLHSRSCMMKCARRPRKASGDLDAFLPDGTPCRDTERSKFELNRLNINLRCVRGMCTEFSDCPDPSHVKDQCGVCGGDGSRCVELQIGSSFNAARGKRNLITHIPAGSSGIEVLTDWKKNKGVQLELSSEAGELIIGKRGRYRESSYIQSNAVHFAGTRWSFKRKTAYLRAVGPTTEGVVITAFRRGNPITDLTIRYARGPEAREASENSEQGVQKI